MWFSCRSVFFGTDYNILPLSVAMKLCFDEVTQLYSTSYLHSYSLCLFIVCVNHKTIYFQMNHSSDCTLFLLARLYIYYRLILWHPTLKTSYFNVDIATMFNVMMFSVLLQSNTPGFVVML